MWYSYFFQIQRKYNMRLSESKPLIIRLDGKNTTKDMEINIIEEYKNSFFNVLNDSAKYFSKRYNAYAILGTDEISFIILEPHLIFDDATTEGNSYCQEVISYFAQIFGDYFNTLFTEKKIFWHAKCFSIKEEKIVPYIRFRSGIIENAFLTYMLKRQRINTDGSIDERRERCKELSNYKQIEKKSKGILYYNGKKIDLNDFYNHSINEKNYEDDYPDIEIEI